MTKQQDLDMMIKSPLAFDLAKKRSALFAKIADSILEILEPEEPLAQDFFWDMVADYFKDAQVRC